MRTRDSSPSPHDVLLRTHVYAVPRLVLRVPTIEIAMVVRKGDEILGPGFGVKLDQFFGIPVFRPPDMTDVLVPKLRRMTVCLDVVVVLGTALNVHASRVPVALLRNA